MDFMPEQPGGAVDPRLQAIMLARALYAASPNALQTAPSDAASGPQTPHRDANDASAVAWARHQIGQYGAQARRAGYHFAGGDPTAEWRAMSAFLAQRGQFVQPHVGGYGVGLPGGVVGLPGSSQQPQADPQMLQQLLEAIAAGHGPTETFPTSPLPQRAPLPQFSGPMQSYG